MTTVGIRAIPEVNPQDNHHFSPHPPSLDTSHLLAHARNL